MPGDALHCTRRGPRALLVLLLTLVVSGGLVGVATAGTSTDVLRTTSVAQAAPDLGPNVIVFSPDMAQADIQARVDQIAAQQVGNQFGTQRYALLFEPGTYGSAADPLIFQVGYYTEVDGLGAAPTDVTINGAVDVLNQCQTAADGSQSCTALDNFWRSMSNLTINVAAQSGCQSDTEFWAVSQAAPMRRVDVTGGNNSFMDYCSAGPQYASGGFVADSAFSGGTVTNGSQQQFLVRNSSLDGWSNGVWNQVFAGDDGAPAQSFPDPPYTTLAQTPVSKEKPYLYIDDSGQWDVFVPAVQSDSHGTTWQQGQTPGRSLPLKSFFIASPSDSIGKINRKLAAGKNLLLTPGVYDVDRTIHVTRARTVVLGLGMATLTAEGGTVALDTADVSGVDIAGLTIDAGPVSSPVLLRVGPVGSSAAHRADPIALQDVFFRIGGPHLGKAAVSLQVNSDDTILDDIWAWRADHGTGVGWTENTARTGVVVNGDRVTATGLFVEHYQGYDVLWKGEAGRTVFFQNEMPYDPPDQAAWQHNGVDGYAAYKVADSVKRHQAWGLGSYIYTNVDPTLHSARGFEVPVTPGVQLHDILTVSLNKAGTIDHVVNDTGDPVTPDVQGPSYVTSYP